LSILIGVGSTWFGLFLSVWFNLASGATIVMVTTGIFFICYFLSPERRKLGRNIDQLRTRMQNQ
ncbi:MAG TPA: metal ABC transporter permease, partial [bacterium]|nr:metal ABC transporter permease [bacterium]